MATRRHFRPMFERLEDRIVLVTWPVPANHDMLNGFGSAQPLQPIAKFHSGIDIRLKLDAEGEPIEAAREVIAARGGKVFHKEPEYSGGHVIIEVSLEGDVKEYDHYVHVSDIVAPARGAPIAEGAPVGKISTSYFSNHKVDHLHYSVYEPDEANNVYPDEDKLLNPLLRFAVAADKDPLEQKPVLRDTNGDGEASILRFFRGGVLIERQPISGDVDMVAEAVDPMSVEFEWSSNPHLVGYYVKPFEGTHGVKSADNPYVLAKFDDNWWNGTEDGTKTQAKYGEVYHSTMVIQQPVIIDVTSSSYIVTNTKGEDGAIGNVDGNQYWNTNAKDDMSEDTVAYANFAGKDDATKNAEARFMDGEYEVHIVLGDVIHAKEDLKVGKTRVVNFERKADPGRGGLPSPGGSPTQVNYPNGNYYPELIPEVVIADVSEKYLIDEVVGVFGEEYYPDFAMWAYVLPHRPDGWMEDDPLVGALAQVVVQSDSDGAVPLTEAWLADTPGKYDIIIDYDNDGQFSWRLDGVGGFHVNAPPIGNTVHFTIHSGDVLEVDPPGVLINDTDADDDPLTAVPHMGPGGGTLSMNPDGSFTYQSYLETVGIETFVYLAYDGNDYSDFVTVTIDVTNTLPVAEDDYYATTIDTPLTIDAPGVLDNDSDADNDTLSVSFLNTSDGTVELASDGSFVYTPSDGFAGTASFAYLLSDEHSNTVSGSVYITVGSGLLLDRPPDADGGDELQMSQMVMLNEFAIKRWRNAGVSDETLSKQLSGLRFQIVELPGSLLAVAGEDATISIDFDGAGYGWFVDSTPRDDDEFERRVSPSERRAAATSSAADDVDLLTVLMHEIGHVLGLDHSHDDRTNVMANILSLGTRRSPTLWDAAIVEYLYSQNRKRN